MSQEKINWDNDTKNAIHGLLNNIGLGEEQAERIVDDIEKSLDWNSELKMFTDGDKVVLDGPTDEETCIECLIQMKLGARSVSDLKEDELWETSPHANCRCNFSYETRMSMNKQQHIHNLIQDFIESHS